MPAARTSPSLRPWICAALAAAPLCADSSGPIQARQSPRFDVNLMGTVRTCRALLVPKMAAHVGGAVVNTGSDLAKQPEPGFIDYGACKAALLYLTKALARQYAPAVRINTVLPGPIWSRMWTRPGASSINWSPTTAWTATPR